MSLSRRLVEHFVLSAPELRRPAQQNPVTRGEALDAACAEPAPRTPAAVAVLAPARDATATGAALGIALARRHRAPAVAVCVRADHPAAWPAWRAPAVPAAHRMTRRLRARGHDARAAGRLAIVRLPVTDDDAASVRRVLAAAAGAPAVLALGGVRRAAIDVLLGEQDLVVVAARSDADPLLARLALAGLAGGARACACEVPAAHPGRALAMAGFLLLPSVRRALATPIAELP